jgi:sugar phosphate permease
MAVHQTSVYCGVVVSGLISGWIADHFGWRAAFLVFGSAGIVLSLFLAARLRDSRAVHPSGRPAVKEILAIARTRPTFPLLTIGFTSLVFVNVGYLTWMPTYLHERFGQSLTHAGFSSMFYHHLFAFAGVLMGGRLSDRVALANPRYRLFVQSGGLLLGAPFIWLTGAVSDAFAVYAAMAAFGIFRGFYECNTYTTVFEVVESRFHASASGIMICFAFLTGAIAPVGLGAIKQASGLAGGISALSAVYVVGGLAVLCAALFSFDTDHKKVSHA